jgi:C4-dicarboxylate transporter DctQ subunit
MKLLSKASGIFDRTVGLLAFLGAAVIIFVTIVVCWDVTSRFFLGHGLGWALEVAEYSLLWFTLLAAAWVLKGERHVKIDMLLMRLHPKTQALLNIITSVLTAVACLVVTWYGATTTWEFFQTGEHLPSEVMPPKFLPYLIIPIGFAFLFVQFLRRAYGYLRGWKVSLNRE